MSVAREIRDLRARLNKAEAQLSKVPSRIGVGGGGGGGGTTDEKEAGRKGRSNCPTVYSLPAVPTAAETFQRVFWTSQDELHEEEEEYEVGTGDDGVWWTLTGYTRWYPITYSTLDGEPGETELI